MKVRATFAVQCAAFALLLTLCVSGLDMLITPKYYSDEAWPSSATFVDFYRLEPNSVDVLFLGSSHAVCGFVPQELYNEYGITSYNLGSEQQSMALSCFWLKEALRYQTPKVVVLDTYFLFPYYDDKQLNASEGHIRKAMDFMRLSPVKMEAIFEICEADPEQEMASYYLPFIRYHTRWNELTQRDFEYRERFATRGLMGYSMLFGANEREDFEPFDAASSDDTAEPMPLMLSYLEEITKICRERGIRLLLLKTPAIGQSLAKHNATRRFAQEHGLDFIDFNECEHYYGGADLWFGEDCFDNEHLNYWGAVKVTNYLGDILQNDYGLEPHEDAYWTQMNVIYQSKAAQEQ